MTAGRKNAKQEPNKSPTRAKQGGARAAMQSRNCKGCGGPCLAAATKVRNARHRPPMQKTKDRLPQAPPFVFLSGVEKADAPGRTLALAAAGAVALARNTSGQGLAQRLLGASQCVVDIGIAVRRTDKACLVQGGGQIHAALQHAMKEAVEALCIRLHDLLIVLR